MEQNNIYDNIKKIISTIDVTNINLKIVKSNIKKLVEIYNELKSIYNSFDYNNIKYDNSNSKYFEIMNILKSSFLFENKNIKKEIDKSKYIHCLSHSNIKIYWISNNKNIQPQNKEYLMALKMFKITISLNKFKYKNNDNIERLIIWIPIDKKRNYKYKIINNDNLKKTEEYFEAFVASGVTFGNNPRITIITRYEEIEKLLIHELIHNYNIDGSEFHNELNEITNKYKNIKNSLGKNKKNYHYDFSIYESYTELLSTYFYLLFENIIQLNDNIEQKLLGQIIIEIIYSYNLVCNLIKLNGYKNYDEFKNINVFDGNICGYEYYYIKALMYNNFILMFGNNLNDYKCIYMNIINMIINIRKYDDKLMSQIYTQCFKQNNFKYQLH